MACFAHCLPTLVFLVSAAEAGMAPGLDGQPDPEVESVGSAPEEFWLTESTPVIAVDALPFETVEESVDASARPSSLHHPYYFLQTYRRPVREFGREYEGLFPNLVFFEEPLGECCECAGREGKIAFTADGIVRAFYRNDQRIEWTGVESTFATEAILRPTVNIRHGKWRFTGHGEFFLNESVDRPLLEDPMRAVYEENFDVDTFEIFQLFVQARRGDLWVRMGRSRTPFGSYFSPSYSNQFVDAPFIRSDIVSPTETGVFLGYRPKWLSFDVGVVNGETGIDTNSDKSFVGRAALHTDRWEIGASFKTNDGIASEHQKRYHDHIGIDFRAYIARRVVLYGEILLSDRYGFHRDFFEEGIPASLGKRSLYGRDVFKGEKDPVESHGAYVGAVVFLGRLLFDLNYGVHSPETLGVPFHDADIQRFVCKIDASLGHGFNLYFVGLVEGDRPIIPPFRDKTPYAFLTGLSLAY